MPVVNRIAGLSEEMKTWRQHLHRNPELGLACHKTAEFVVARLKDAGITDIHTGIAESGVVAIIEGREGGPTIGLRADMDALPIAEETGAPWASEVAGAMHACGHDGHTTMLLGAAKYLAETRNFAGRAALIFQPAEENEGGGRIMVEEGMMDRFDIKEVYGIHNVPGLDLGYFYTKPGPIMAGADTFHVYIEGRGGHGAYPQETRDPIAAGLAVGQAFQSIVARNHNPMQELVVSLTQFHSGSADNVIPDTAYLNGTVRIFDKAVRDMVRTRMTEICDGISTAYDLTCRLDYEEGYPPTINHDDQAAFAAEVARDVVGPDMVNGNTGAEMGAEDFSYMLEARPGAYVFLGTGEGSGGLHHPKFDFNDEASAYGASFFARLIEKALPLKG